MVGIGVGGRVGFTVGMTELGMDEFATELGLEELTTGLVEMTGFTAGMTGLGGTTGLTTAPFSFPSDTPLPIYDHSLHSETRTTSSKQHLFASGFGRHFSLTLPTHSRFLFTGTPFLGRDDFSSDFSTLASPVAFSFTSSFSLSVYNEIRK